jgi:uncharacterized sporulation protein YeaH/YhbH (DUF444 family)
LQETGEGDRRQEKGGRRQGRGTGDRISVAGDRRESQETGEGRQEKGTGYGRQETGASIADRQYSTIDRLDQGHLHPQLEVPGLEHVLAGNRIEYSRQLVKSYSEHLHR